ncbi:hypothetical protein TL16_g08279 [Triparma laevis f. inornata]|uniref:GST N-terminal domain-containing protein n=1 Tax=Triparma laevis f. inornata TaxID=1714386 RepID=A0A9W7B0C9_9STRA|nr:hypothetical protein TL16_g08279 [Triparma laevis f. inornata]
MSDMIRTLAEATNDAPKTISYRFSPSDSAAVSVNYFDFGGKAEAARLLCFHGKVSFDDVRYGRDQFRAKKAAGLLPFGQMPMLAYNSAFIPQTNSILRVCARVSSDSTLYPISDIVACGQIDAILDLDADLFTGVVVANYKERFGFDFLNNESEVAKVEGVKSNLRTRVFPAHLANLEKMVGEGGWLGGENTTIAIEMRLHDER